MKDTVKVTVIATGFDQPVEKGRRPRRPRPRPRPTNPSAARPAEDPGLPSRSRQQTPPYLFEGRGARRAGLGRRRASMQRQAVGVLRDALVHPPDEALDAEKDRPMISADLVVAGCRELVTCAGPLPKRGQDLRQIGLVENGWVASSERRHRLRRDRGRFPAAGRRPRLERSRSTPGAWSACPGSSTPTPICPSPGTGPGNSACGSRAGPTSSWPSGAWASRRRSRRRGRPASTTSSGLSLQRLDRMLLTGTTTVEAKSGYGLNLEDEVKQLEALRDAAALHPVDVVPTFMGAHEVPPEYRDKREDYVRLLIDFDHPGGRAARPGRVLRRLLRSPASSRSRRRGGSSRRPRPPASRSRSTPTSSSPRAAAELAAEVGAVSAEHLIAVSDEGIAGLGASATAAILLPGVSFFLMMDKRAPARRLIDAGAAVALASDFNPGSSHLSSMPFVLQLGVFTLGMTVEEAINACTANAAYAIGRHGTVGSLEAGEEDGPSPLRRPGPCVSGLRGRAQPGPDGDQERPGRRRGRPQGRPALMSPRFSPRFYVLRLAWLGRRAAYSTAGAQSPPGSRASFKRPVAASFVLPISSLNRVRVISQVTETTASFKCPPLTAKVLSPRAMWAWMKGLPSTVGDVAVEGDDLVGAGQLDPGVFVRSGIEVADLGLADGAQAVEEAAADRVPLAERLQRLDDLLPRVEPDDVGRAEDEIFHATSRGTAPGLSAAQAFGDALSSFPFQ